MKGSLTVVCVRGEHTACLGGRCPCDCHPSRSTLPVALAVAAFVGAAAVLIGIAWASR